MKVLIVTYYWPPAGGPGVQRWLKFVKYLRDFDIEPVVYTVKDPKYAIFDDDLEEEVPDGIEILREPIWEPNVILSLFGSNNKKTSAGFLKPNPSFFGKIAQYIRANFFIPDARKFWVKPSVKALEAYLRDNSIDLVITTGPPHSIHLIGLQLKEKLHIKWMADFRDPWTEIDYFHQLPLTNGAKKKHQDLEQNVLTKADTILVVGKTMKTNFGKFNSNVKVITNGYDTVNSKYNIPLDTQFSLVHVGLMNSDRNHTILWQVLRELCNENKDFKRDLQLKFVGSLTNDVKDAIEIYELTENAEFIDYVPHNEVSKHQQSAQVLLLPVNNVPSAKGIVTGKIFEYLQANRPILAIAPIDGDLAEIINETKSGVVVEFDDAKRLKVSIRNMYLDFKDNSLHSTSQNIEKYHRKELTNKLAETIKEM